MSSDAPVPLPRTAVPLGITDPVEKARADQKQMMSGLKYTTLIPEGQKAPGKIR